MLVVGAFFAFGFGAALMFSAVWVAVHLSTSTVVAPQARVEIPADAGQAILLEQYRDGVFR